MKKGIRTEKEKGERHKQKRREQERRKRIALITKEKDRCTHFRQLNILESESF